MHLIDSNKDIIIHSYDIAIKSMSLCVFRINKSPKRIREQVEKHIITLTSNLENNRHNYDKSTYESMKINIDSLSSTLVDFDELTEFPEILYIDVWDLSDNRLSKSDVINPCRNLMSKLNEIKTLYPNIFPPNKVLFERQMSHNDKSRSMSRFIIAYYAMIDQMNNYMTDIKEIPAFKKNLLSLSTSLVYKNFAGKYAQSYTANKNHSKANLIYWSKIMNLSISHIKKKNIDDAADAFMQALSYYIIK